MAFTNCHLPTFKFCTAVYYTFDSKKTKRAKARLIKSERYQNADIHDRRKMTMDCERFEVHKIKHKNVLELITHLYAVRAIEFVSSGSEFGRPGNKPIRMYMHMALDATAESNTSESFREGPRKSNIIKTEGTLNSLYLRYLKNATMEYVTHPINMQKFIENLCLMENSLVITNLRFAIADLNRIHQGIVNEFETGVKCISDPVTPSPCFSQILEDDDGNENTNEEIHYLLDHKVMSDKCI